MNGRSVDLRDRGDEVPNKADISLPHVQMPNLTDDEDPPSGASPDAEAIDRLQLQDKGAPRSRWLLKLALEVALISVGVFLALMGEQWRESAHTRELAEASLRGFRSEILANRQTVAAVKEYHVTLLKSLQAHLAADTKAPERDRVQIQGLQPVFFEHTAWDLALATQSLAHIDTQLAFGLSRTYGLQRTYAEQTRGIMQAIYLRPLTENFEGLAAYYGDLVLWEPELLQMYEELLPQIDRALGDSRSQSLAAQ